MIDIICICIIHDTFYRHNRPDEVCKVKVTLMRSAQRPDLPNSVVLLFGFLFGFTHYRVTLVSFGLSQIILGSAVVLVNNVRNYILNF